MDIDDIKQNIECRILLSPAGPGYLLGKTFATSAKIKIENNNPCNDRLIETVLDTSPISDQMFFNKQEEERLLKDALALSQDVYVINGHSDNFYHTYSKISYGQPWHLLNNNIKIEEHPKDIQAFWEQVSNLNFNNPSDGFGSALFYTQFKVGLYIVAYVTEGTATFIDWINNIMQGAIMYAPQYKDSSDNAKLIANAFNNTLKNKARLYFFGHSLGGGLANKNALVTGFPSITFNAASLHTLNALNPNYKKNLLLGIYVDGEALSSRLSRYTLGKDGARYKVQLTNEAYNTKSLNGLINKIPAVRKHMLEPLFEQYYGSKIVPTKWNKSNEI